jgi:hypothetical protein
MSGALIQAWAGAGAAVCRPFTLHPHVFLQHEPMKWPEAVKMSGTIDCFVVDPLLLIQGDVNLCITNQVAV